MKTRDRDPAATRAKIVDVAAEEIHEKGFRAASLSAILRRSELSKGAFYHHFPTKHELGLAVLDEQFAQMLRDGWDPVFRADDPYEALLAHLRDPCCEMTRDAVRRGCPLNNLIAEMSSQDDDFRSAIGALLDRWRGDLSEALGRSQEGGSLAADVDTDRLAAFVVAAVEGAAALGKNAQDPAVTGYSLGCLVDYLEGLRAA